MDDTLYKEIILEHWQHPQNYGVIKNPDFDITNENTICGDEICLTGKFNKDKLEQIAFSGQGCAISQASASMFTERIKGLTKKEIRQYTANQVLEEFGVTLSPARTKCALLVYQTMQNVLH